MRKIKDIVGRVTIEESNKRIKRFNVSADLWVKMDSFTVSELELMTKLADLIIENRELNNG